MTSSGPEWRDGAADRSAGSDPSSALRLLLQEASPLLRLLIDHLPDCIFMKDTSSRFLLNNRAHARVCGVASPADLIGKTDFDFFPPELAQRYFADDRRVIESGTPIINHEERVVLSDGSDAWFLTTKVPVRFSDGTLCGLIGISRDITEHRYQEDLVERERRLLRTLIDNMPDYIFVKDRESRFIINNKAHLNILGVSCQADIVGKTDFDVFPRELAQRYFADEQYVVSTGEAIIGREEPARNAAGERIWLSTTKVPIRDKQGHVVGLVGISRDITDRRRAEETLHRAKKELEVRVAERTADLKEVNAHLAARLDQLRFLHEISSELAQYIRMDEVGPAIVKAFLARMGNAQLSICLREKDGFRFLCATSGLSTPQDKEASVAAVAIFRELEFQKPLMCANWHADDRIGKLAWSVVVEHLPCYIAIPLLADNRMLAVVQIFTSAEFAQRYDAELPVLTTLASHAAICLSNARHYHEVSKNARMQGELDAARSIQQRFTPQEKPLIPRLDVKGVYVPAYEVGGDYLDYFRTESGYWVMAVADVCGKGVPAALFMIMLRSAFRMQSRRISGAKELLCAVNEAMLLNLDDRSFVTALCLVVDPQGTVMTCARAGHPMLLRCCSRSGWVEPIVNDGVAMGLGADSEAFAAMLEETTLALEEGDKFFAYTDGLTEATNAERTPYGFDRLIGLLERCRNLRPDALVETVLQDVQRFCRPESPRDDLTMLAIEVVKNVDAW